MAKVFISYSSKNRDLVKSLADDIEALGHLVWFDKELTGGHAWWDSILQAILYCDVFIFALSPESLNSEPCSREYSYAFALGKTILPVLISGAVSPNLLPRELSLVQFVDYRQRDNSSALRLGRAFSALPFSQALPNPLPIPPPAPVAPILGLREQVDNPNMLSFEQQSALLMQLKTELKDPASQSDALELLQRFRRRRDLMASVGDEIDELIRQKPIASLHTQKAVQDSKFESSIWMPNLDILIASGFIWGVLCYIFWIVGLKPDDSSLLFAAFTPWFLQGLLVARLLHWDEEKSVLWYLRAVVCGGPLVIFQAYYGKKRSALWKYILGFVLIILLVFATWIVLSDFAWNSLSYYEGEEDYLRILRLNPIGKIVFAGLSPALWGIESAYLLSVFYNLAKQQALGEL